HWAPNDPEIKASLRPRLKVEALEAIRRGGPHLTASDCAKPGGHATRTLFLSTESGPLGAAALAWSSAEVARDPKTVPWIVAVVEMVASTAISRSEVSNLRLQAERDKRWFKTLDEHLCVLYPAELPIKVLDGKPHEAMVLVQDLTGLETLRQSEVRYSALFEANAEAILMVDPETHQILLANPATQRMLGHSPQQLAKLSLRSLHSPDDWERLRGFYEAAAGHEAPSRIEC